ncbi:Nuclear transport factor 2,TAP C-terminal (TAP-C) domain,Nuclear transport factor 2, eukaryote,UBA- [Cinara cedri]|uniref:Nuclear transport factor 2,TAP C-terminal (TAP-C) domain,Nuclear transport factor 2, eukaryote,UBA n=1 Tax=Cinara cedri TaxID=506608 RepID=A0A5E4N138_9HEMI|nr:Nuclear transport factor 2,TAP C-terminal (TAP-C) domain,Nuclear transport factor 2, eukaryote,UBA- [Cinara cedri]
MDYRSARGRFSWMSYVNSHNDHDNKCSRPSTSRGDGNYSDNFNTSVAFKARRGGSHYFRKNWSNKTNLVRNQINSHQLENSNQTGLLRNDLIQGYIVYCDNHGNLKFTMWTLQESSTGWYSIYVINNDYDEILNVLQAYISPITFYPYNKKMFGNALRFVIDDYKIAQVLQDTSYKITLKNGRKLIIKVGLYVPSRTITIFTPVSNEIREKMIEAMATRYNSSTKSLDLSKFYACPLFIEKQLFVPLNRPAILLAALNIVAEHTKSELFGLSLENNHIYMSEGLVWISRLFPNLKVLDLSGNKFSDLNELNCLQGFSIEVINLSRNPVSDNIKDKECYRQNVQQLFPMLKKLDNTELPLRYSVAIVNAKLKMPVNLGNNFAVPAGHNPDQPNPVKDLVKSFLEQYYERYDNKLSRQMIAEAYHKNAIFSLSCFQNYGSNGNLSKYLSDCRNLLKPDQNKKRVVHIGKENIINFLDNLPETKHDMVSFLVDVPLVDAKFIQIVVNGVFAENFKETQQRPLFRSFCRAFCIVPFGSGWSILNDMLFVTEVNDDQYYESSKRFILPKSNLPNSNAPDCSDNTSMVMEDSEEMTSIKLSSSYQQDLTPNYPPPQYQQTSFSTYPSSSIAEIPVFTQQQQPFYQEGLQMSLMQNPQQAYQQNNQLASSSTEPVSFQSIPQQLNNSFYMVNNTTATTFPASSIQIPILTNQPSTEVSTNSDEKLTLIKNFSKESGMNNIWAKKCLEENDWNYTQAVFCFSKLKPNIPPAAFT